MTTSSLSAPPAPTPLPRGDLRSLEPRGRPAHTSSPLTPSTAVTPRKQSWLKLQVAVLAPEGSLAKKRRLGQKRLFHHPAPPSPVPAGSQGEDSELSHSPDSGSGVTPTTQDLGGNLPLLPPWSQLTHQAPQRTWTRTDHVYRRSGPRQTKPAGTCSSVLWALLRTLPCWTTVGPPRPGESAGTQEQEGTRSPPGMDWEPGPAPWWPRPCLQVSDRRRWPGP